MQAREQGLREHRIAHPSGGYDEDFYHKDEG
jgi:hypothetical protein